MCTIFVIQIELVSLYSAIHPFHGYFGPGYFEYYADMQMFKISLSKVTFNKIWTATPSSLIFNNL